MTPHYRRTVRIEAPPEHVFGALTTLDGLAAWWTPVVTGAPIEGGRVSFHFDHEVITMAVSRARTAELVEWSCLRHTKFPEWDGTTLTFELSRTSDGATTLAFDHAGLAPASDCYEICSNGWDHYLGSLTEHAEGRPGRPWRSKGHGHVSLKSSVWRICPVMVSAV